MEIELVTTKKKLTASIIKQIPFASSLEKELLLEHPSKIYGYVTLTDGDYILAKGREDLVKIRAKDWKANSDPSSTYLSHKNEIMAFKSTEVRNRWLEVYNKILKLGKQTHIYL
jgi:hypothetical protein